MHILESRGRLFVLHRPPDGDEKYLCEIMPTQDLKETLFAFHDPVVSLHDLAEMLQLYAAHVNP